MLPWCRTVPSFTESSTEWKSCSSSVYLPRLETAWPQVQYTCYYKITKFQIVLFRSSRVVGDSRILVHSPVGRCLRLQLLEIVSLSLLHAYASRRRLPFLLPGESEVSYVARSHRGCFESFQTDLYSKYRETRRRISGKLSSFLWSWFQMALFWKLRETSCVQDTVLRRRNTAKSVSGERS